MTGRRQRLEFNRKPSAVWFDLPLEIRDALIRFALACVDNNDPARMRIALVEMNRLDKTHGYGPSAESPHKLI